MSNLAEIEHDWVPLCNDNLVEIPTENPVICMEHRQTKEHAYYDVNRKRFLTQQEAFDIMRGNNIYYLRAS
jgi:hypothetical protein